MSQNVDKSSALELPATVLLQNISNASFNACKSSQNEIYYLITINHSIIQQVILQLSQQTLWNSVWFIKQSLTYAIYLSWSSRNFRTRTCKCHMISLQNFLTSTHTHTHTHIITKHGEWTYWFPKAKTTNSLEKMKKNIRY